MGGSSNIYSKSTNTNSRMVLCALLRINAGNLQKNYKGVAQVTTRRSRKGFELKYNPDCHWSGALYRNLNHIQYTDGSNITNINRDDASGFRLDTLATHCKHGTAAVRGENVLTTHTDYVNRYPSLLQTTSYNFSGTRTTKEMAAGVVKGAKVYP